MGKWLTKFVIFVHTIKTLNWFSWIIVSMFLRTLSCLSYSVSTSKTASPIELRYIYYGQFSSTVQRIFSLCTLRCQVPIYIVFAEPLLTSCTNWTPIHYSYYLKKWAAIYRNFQNIFLCFQYVFNLIFSHCIAIRSVDTFFFFLPQNIVPKVL